VHRLTFESVEVAELRQYSTLRVLEVEDETEGTDVQFRQFQFGCFRLEGEIALHLKLTGFRKGQPLQRNRLGSALGTRGQLECVRAVERPMTAAVPVRDVTDLRSDETEVAGVTARETLGVVAE